MSPAKIFGAVFQITLFIRDTPFEYFTIINKNRKPSKDAQI